MSRNPRQRPLPEPVSLWLSRLGEASPAARHAAHLAEAAAHFRACLPPALAEDAALANIRGTTWVCVADNGTVAHRLRLVLPRLAGCLRGRGLNVSEVRVEVRARPGSPLPVPKRAVLSPAAHASLDELARQLGDSELGSAVRRLRDRSGRGRLR